MADDASTDGTAEWLATAHPEVRLVRLERNQGFCAAANAGIAAARGRFIQLLNNDTEVARGWIEAGLAPFADATVGSVAPLVLVRSDPTRVDSAGDSYTLAGWPTKRGHGQPAAVFATRPVEEVFGASGSSAFYRAEALRRAGAFDPLFGSYYEDVDLAFRLRWAGYRCVFTPASPGSITTSRRPTTTTAPRSSAAWPGTPRSSSGRTCRPACSPLALLPHLAFLAVQALWRLARGRLSPFLLGQVRCPPRLAGNPSAAQAPRRAGGIGRSLALPLSCRVAAPFRAGHRLPASRAQQPSAVVRESDQARAWADERRSRSSNVSVAAGFGSGPAHLVQDRGSTQRVVKSPVRFDDLVAIGCMQQISAVGAAGAGDSGEPPETGGAGCACPVRRRRPPSG